MTSQCIEADTVLLLAVEQCRLGEATGHTLSPAVVLKLDGLHV